jgi:Restriction endonuclease
LSAIWVFLSLVSAVVVAALGELVSDEIRARLDLIPLALLAAVGRRLPASERAGLYEQAWLPELHHILRGDQATPITRLIHGTRFAIGLWLVAPRICRELGITSAGQHPVSEDITDGRLDLLSVRPVEFEHLVRELFTTIGLRSWITQASRDSGIDMVAINDAPILGGLCIVQAKRYSRIVGVEAIYALAGVMEDKHAAKGVLVTTSWVGKASHDFAARHGRIEIIEGHQLKYMLKEHLGLDALIGLPGLPAGREQQDTT